MGAVGSGHMTFSTHDSVIIPLEKNHGVVQRPSPSRNEHTHINTHSRTKNYKYPCIQWITGSLGILMIITAVITIMIQDVGLYHAFFHHTIHKWCGG